MIINAKIESIKSLGYERFISISTKDISIGRLWCYFVDVKKFAELESDYGSLHTNQQVKMELSIVWILEYKIMDNSQSTSYKQTVNKSTHIESVAEIVNIIDERTLICDIGDFKEITVNLEVEHKDIRIGDKIWFEGSLAAEILE